jgi:hypothetical protein
MSDNNINITFRNKLPTTNVVMLKLAASLQLDLLVNTSIKNFMASP